MIRMVIATFLYQYNTQRILKVNEMKFIDLIKAKYLVAVVLMCTAGSSFAGSEAFKPGTQIKEFGKIASVDTTVVIPKDTKFKIVFDVATTGDAGTVNRKFDSLARFINMHVANGVKPENIDLALVVHGKATLDVQNAASVEAKQLGENKNIPLLQSLLDNNVKIYLCGQSAAFYDVKTADLYPGVDMALSAMTANALLQQQGYTLNP